MRDISVYERLGRCEEQRQQNAEALTDQIEKTKQVAEMSSKVLAALKAGTLRLDQIDIDANGSWQTFPDRPEKS